MCLQELSGNWSYGGEQNRHSSIISQASYLNYDLPVDCKHDAGQDLHVMAPVFISKYNLVLNFGFKNETMSYNEPHKVKSKSFCNLITETLLTEEIISIYIKRTQNEI